MLQHYDLYKNRNYMLLSFIFPRHANSDMNLQVHIITHKSNNFCIFKFSIVMHTSVTVNNFLFFQKNVRGLWDMIILLFQSRQQSFIKRSIPLSYLNFKMNLNDVWQDLALLTDLGGTFTLNALTIFLMQICTFPCQLIKQ